MSRRARRWSAIAGLVAMLSMQPSLSSSAGETGCSLDPDGCSGTSRAPLVETGCSLDPNGCAAHGL